MKRSILGILLALGLAGAAGEARAQFIGPGSTPAGDYLRGVGLAAWGMGQYNLNTAYANRVNLETAILFEEYVGAVMRTQARERAERRAAQRAQYDELHGRYRENPNDLDVLRGDALNAVLKQLLDPALPESSFRYAEVRIPGEVIRQIPFLLVQDKARFSMNRLTLRDRGKWPVAFQGARFAAYLRSYEHALDVVLDQAIKQKMTKEAIGDLQKTVENLRVKLDIEFPPSTDPRYLEAKARLQELEATVELLKRHKVELAIGEIEQYHGTNVNDLRLFMQRHNLQFAPARTPDERSLYPELHAFLVEQREKLKGSVPLDPRK